MKQTLRFWAAVLQAWSMGMPWLEKTVKFDSTSLEAKQFACEHLP